MKENGDLINQQIKNSLIFGNNSDEIEIKI